MSAWIDRVFRDGSGNVVELDEVDGNLARIAVGPGELALERDDIAVFKEWLQWVEEVLSENKQG